MARSTDLRIKVQRQNSFTAAATSPNPFVASPVPDASSGSFPSFSNENETPPSTPPCSSQGFNLLAPGGPGMFGRRTLLRRNSSMSSVSSSVGDGAESDEEWTREEEDKLKATYDAHVEAVDRAPFAAAGPPPSNLTQVVARAVITTTNSRVTRSSKRAQRGSGSVDAAMPEVDHADNESEVQKWRHGLKSTRVKILALVKERQSTLEATPTQDPDATPKRVQMARQGSMDFLPAARNVGIVARLGSKLQRAEQNGPPRSGHRPRLSRTGSLTSIAGSPSQPLKAPAAAAPSSSRMSRIGSDTTGRNLMSFDHELPLAHSNPTSAITSPLFNLTFDQSSTGLAPPPSSSASAFSFPPNSKTPKRANASTSGLGSAFSSPSLGAYPTPTSQHKKKAKFTHHSPSNSLELKQGASKAPPPALALQAPFESPFGGVGLGLGGAFESSPKKKSSPSSLTGGRLGASTSFYLAGEDSAMSNASLSSLDSAGGASDFFPTMRASSSMSSFASTPGALAVEHETTLKQGTPSPMSSTFDLNDLSLDALEGESSEGEMAMEQDESKGKGTEEPVDYWAAGKEAQELREQLGTWDWSRQ